MSQKTNNPYREVSTNLNQLNSEHGNEPLKNYTTTSIAGETPIPSVVTVNTTQAFPPGMPIIPQPVGPKSTTLTCPHCRCRIRTRVDHRSTSKTHIACLLLSWTLCCCCLPYCMDSCRNANHFCPMCGAFIGTYAS
ncbi:lipopolysaccharide-induced tumor necrosis factor-alpha factor homolog isoform X1 [Haematobia irritans]|uniref:Putative lipopolysaccharide-induced tumor necrosis factor-alpha factor n=1 Tax=Haematobia irritans TaxID=7368 RepID=A0A1L8E611_HAEIR